MVKKTIWILLDNRIGSRHQAEGVANYLDKTSFNIIYKDIEYTKFGALPNFIRGKTLLGVDSKSRKNLLTPWPDIVLSASRRTAPVARWIKKQHHQTKLIQLLHIGRWGIGDFEFIFAPEHDKHKFNAPNIKYTIGSPHSITAEKLEKAKEEWQNTFAILPHPITALIIGGSIKGRPFSLENAQNLATFVKEIKEREGGSLLITTSRRTGKEAEQKILANLQGIPQYSYLWGDTGPNPYLGFLACADNLIVTGDSVSMCCEATSTNKPLKIFTGNNWLTAKHLRFVQSLFDKRYASDISDTAPTKHQPNTLNVAKEISAIISHL